MGLAEKLANSIEYLNAIRINRVLNDSSSFSGLSVDRLEKEFANPNRKKPFKAVPKLELPSIQRVSQLESSENTARQLSTVMKKKSTKIVVTKRGTTQATQELHIDNSENSHDSKKLEVSKSLSKIRQRPIDTEQD